MDKREKFLEELRKQVHDPAGWLSDAQDAALELDEWNDSISFSGEGIIDLHHIGSIAVEAFSTGRPGTEPQPDPKIEALRRALYDEGNHPAYHREQVVHLMDAWPTLYDAIKELVSGPDTPF